MGFHDIKKVELDTFYIDVAFRKATQVADKLRGKFISRDVISKSKQIESAKVKAVKKELADRLIGIIQSFPDLDDLHEFYRELMKANLEWRVIKQSLGAVNWAHNQVVEFGVRANHKINKSMTPSVMNRVRREYYGRCSSFLKQIRKNLMYLEQTRLVMKKFPNIKTGLKTIAIVGFPNVGKTTLLYKLTGSQAEINSYAFTTKGINVGYFTKEKKEGKNNKGKDGEPKEKRKKGKQSKEYFQREHSTAAEYAKKQRNKIQLLDTPGTLNRPERMNPIEKTAYLALTLLADKAIYVFDLTEPFPLKDQMKLYSEVKKVKIPLVTYISKTDILKKEEYKDFADKVNAVTSLEEVKKFLK